MKTDVAPLSGEIEPLWEMKDVMRYLGFGYTQTWRLIHQFGLPYSKLGGKTSPLRFRPEEVRAWVIQHEITHEAKPRSADS